MLEDNSSINPQYTCITCRVMFCDLETQKQHYKCDWHRYNLKRKVAKLPPLPVEDFKKRIAEQQEINKPTTDSLQCKICKKRFSSKNQYDNHINSKKHKDRETKKEHNDDEEMPQVSKPRKNDDHKKDNIEKTIETDSEVESLDSYDWLEDANNPAIRNDCIFCNNHSRSWVRNLKHMSEVHSFFIPDIEYCTDVKGLLEYLGEKVYIDHMCIWCCEKGKAFHSAEAAQTHMIDKGHCKMLHEVENLIEYEDYYDYSSSYPDADDVDPDEEVDIPLLDSDEFQLVLPSGSVIGHRSLMRYYKQSFNPNSVVSVTKSQKLKKVMSMYRALGWKGDSKESVAKKARDIRYMHRVQAKYSMKLQLKQNKMQFHFRQQVNF